MRLFNEQGQYIKTVENLPIYSKSAGGFYTDNFKYLSNTISKDLVSFFDAWIKNNFQNAENIKEIVITSLYRDPNKDPYPSEAHGMNAACDFAIYPAYLMPFFFTMIHRYFNWRVGISIANYHIHVDHLRRQELGGCKFVEIDAVGRGVWNDPNNLSDDYDKLYWKVLDKYYSGGGSQFLDHIFSGIRGAWREHVPAEQKLSIGMHPLSNTTVGKLGDAIENLPSYLFDVAKDTFVKPSWIAAGLIAWAIYRKSKGQPVIPPSLKRKINQLTAKKKTA